MWVTAPICSVTPTPAVDYQTSTETGLLRRVSAVTYLTRTSPCLTFQSCFNLLYGTLIYYYAMTRFQLPLRILAVLMLRKKTVDDRLKFEGNLNATAGGKEKQT